MRSYGNACGLLVLALVGAATESRRVRAVASLCVVNGLLCHLSGLHACMCFDVLCNLALCVLINATTEWQPGTLVCTALAGAAFLYSHQRSQLVHVLGVQCVLSYALWRW
jgi:hypothetical protein